MTNRETIQTSKLESTTIDQIKENIIQEYKNIQIELIAITQKKSDLEASLLKAEGGLILCEQMGKLNIENLSKEFKKEFSEKEKLDKQIKKEIKQS